VSEPESAVRTRRHADADSSRARRTAPAFLRNRRLGGGALAAIAAFIALVVWLVVESGDDSTKSGPTNAPVVLSDAGLETLATVAPQPIYWVGAEHDTKYELTRTPTRVYVRYLPIDVKAGDPRPFLTIGTYAMKNAYDVMARSAEGTKAIRTPGGGVAIIDKRQPTSVYVAYPDADYQVEVYSPDASAARRLAVSGRVQPVPKATDANKGGGPEAATLDDLRALAAKLGHPIYWAGERSGTTYELTQTPSGRVYVRYLPDGVAIGDKRPYLTIATYPLARAFAATKASAKLASSATIKLPNGRLAVYDKANPTNVHLADPGATVQVEVYDPSPNVPRKLVSSGLVGPVG